MKTVSKIALTLGATAIFACQSGIAQNEPPTEHKGLTVEKLGAIPEVSMVSQVGLKGHILLLRRITIAPGGQIAKHSHKNVPGVVYVDGSVWVEGRDSGEIVSNTFIEDMDTEHWFYNRGTEPAAAYVCDIKPAK